MDLLSMMTGAMTSEAALGSLAGQTDLTGAQTKSVINAALPLLLGAMTQNASTEAGASSLLGALTQHQSQASVQDQLKEADREDGGKIIGHIFGNKKEEAAEEIARKSGVSTAQVLGLLALIAPVLLNGVGKAANDNKKKKKAGIDLSDGLDAGDVIGLLGKVAGGGTAAKTGMDGSALLGILAGMMK